MNAHATRRPPCCKGYGAGELNERQPVRRFLAAPGADAAAFHQELARLGRKREHDRQVLNSLVYRLKTGCRYRDIPRDPEYATPSTTFDWFKTVDRSRPVQEDLAGAPRPPTQHRRTRPQQGQPRRQLRAREKGGQLVDRGAKGNGSTIMVASEGQGIPVAFHLAQSSTHESQLARETLAEVRLPQVGRGRPKTRILEIAMDRAFDARDLRRDLLKRGIRSSIPERKRRGKRRQRGPKPKQYPVSKERCPSVARTRRNKVERINAWFRAKRDWLWTPTGHL